jgi:chromosome segregation ATPase
MKPFPQLPSEVVHVLGPAASSKLLDYLFEIHSLLQEETASMAEGRFEKRLTQEVSGLKSDFAELRADMSEFRMEVKTELAEIRTEIADLRGETRSAISDLRAEMRVSDHDLRAEMQGGFGDLRAEMHGSLGELRAEMHGSLGELRAETQSGLSELRGEMLVMFAGVQKEFVRVHEKIADLHGSITSQTKWILTGLALAVTLYPVINRLMSRLLP